MPSHLHVRTRRRCARNAHQANTPAYDAENARQGPRRPSRTLGLQAAAVALSLLAAAVVHADTHYVSSSGADVPPYSTLTDAATSVQKSIDVAEDGDTVFVAPGTYSLASEITLAKSMVIQGIDGAARTIIDGGNSNRCFNLANAGAVIDGFTIIHGASAAGGGGILCSAGTIRNCVIADNCAVGSSGGGILVSGSLVMEKCAVMRNRADVGAGLEVRESLDMDGCVVSGNVARVDAGGIKCGRNISIGNSAIVDNVAGRDGGGIDTSYRTSLTISNSTISGNKAISSSASHGGGVQVIGTASAVLQDCIVTGNQSAYQGGGIFNADRLSLVGCKVENNSATSGGGLFNYPGRTASAENCRLEGNTATQGPDVHGTLTSLGKNTVGSTQDCVIEQAAAK